MTKDDIRQARIERNPQPWEMDDFILAMCERQRQEDVKTFGKPFTPVPEPAKAPPTVAELAKKAPPAVPELVKKTPRARKKKK